MKTAALITFSCESGAILGRASAAARNALSAYGQDLGLAFQIVDDLLDAEGDPARMGKAAGKDAGRGKPTVVSILGTERARAHWRHRLQVTLICLMKGPTYCERQPISWSCGGRERRITT
jgi:farnesyl diphosphate synthase